MATLKPPPKQQKTAAPPGKKNGQTKAAAPPAPGPAGEENTPPTPEGDLLEAEEDEGDALDDLEDGDVPVDIDLSDEALQKPLAPGMMEGGFALAPALADQSKDSLQLYLREISKFSLLQPEEEVMLARRVQETGDPDAAFRLVSSHLRLVVRIAMDFQRRWMQNVLDLVQEGNVGLVKAVSKFDPEKGIKFSYYASFWIKAYILKFIMDNWRMVKVGTTQTQRKLFYNLNRERQHLIAQGFDPDPEVLAERLNTTREQIIEMEQRLDSFDMSLDTPVNEDESGGSTRMDYLPALGPGIEETLNNKQMAHLVRERLEDLEPSLSDKEKYILHTRLLSDDPVTLREIGEHFSITRERVRQSEARLLQKVRDHLRKNITDFSQEWMH